VRRNRLVVVREMTGSRLAGPASEFIISDVDCSAGLYRIMVKCHWRKASIRYVDWRL